MHRVLKILIAAVVGILTMWICYQPLHLEQAVTTVVSIITTLAAYSICDKLGTKKDR